MKWKDCAIADLRKYMDMKESLQNIPERIQSAELRIKSIQSSTTGATPVQGGGSQMEEALVNNIVERDRLKLVYHATLKLVRLIERGLDGLTKEERICLDGFFIIRPKDYIDDLVKRLGYERTQIYRLKDAALYKFTIRMYGIEEY